MKNKIFIFIVSLALSLLQMHFALAAYHYPVRLADTIRSGGLDGSGSGSGTGIGSGTGSGTGIGSGQTGSGGTQSSGSSSGSGCALDQQATQICNPLPDSDVKGFILRFLQNLIGVIGVLAVIMLVIAGARMIISGGKEDSIKGAKNMATWAAIGLIAAILAYSIVAIISNAINQ